MNIHHAFRVPTRAPPLRSLKLTTVSATFVQLQDIYENLASTFKELKLEDIQLCRGSWLLMWRSMASTHQLCRFKLRTRFRGPSENCSHFPHKWATNRLLPTLTADTATIPWSQTLSILDCFYWERKPSTNVLQELEAWLVSNGQGPFPIVPFFTPRCRDHHSPSKKMFGALRRESAIREMLLDTSFDFARDERSPPRRYQAKSCPKTCKNFVEKRIP
jgi:hypothetical protein